MSDEKDIQQEPQELAEFDNDIDTTSEELQPEALFTSGDDVLEPERFYAPKKVSLTVFVTSLICVVLATVMITYNCCINFMRRDIGVIVAGNNAPSTVVKQEPTELDVIEAFFKNFSFVDIDDEELLSIAIKAYVDNSGDRYAEYYTDEEWQELFDKSAGKAEGVGVNIIDSQIVVDGVEQKALKIFNVIEGSPAQGKLRVGDLIVCVGNGDDFKTVDELGYDVALDELKGEAGTIANFTVYRPIPDSAGEYEKLEFSIEREHITTTSVYSRVSTLDESVGIVKITKFDDTAPAQFCEAVDSLLEAGCDKFVFDVRYNLGGSLDSVIAVLSYFLNEGDPVIHTCDRNGKYVTTTVGVAEYVTEEDIGKYAGLNAVVLCNERTASAAELFTANFRDYAMGTIVGVKTYGKGSMQSLYSLDAYGVSGGLKLTTKMYYPPSGEGYDGIGITPDVEVALDDTLLDKSVFEIKDDEDNQLRVALEYFK